MATSKVSEFTCEQVYNLWMSEPELLTVIDVRPREEFEKGHVPGACHLNEADLVETLRGLHGKVAVLISTKGDEGRIARDLAEFENFVFLKECHRWQDLKLPLATHLEPIEFVFDRKKGVDVKNDIIFQQLFESETSTYTYIVADKKTREAVIIDPVLETVDRDIKLIEELGLKLIYALDTHIHADHITGAGELRRRMGVKTAVSKDADVDCVDVKLEDGQELLIGDKKLRVISTPGHTNTCLTFYFEGLLFTGDALLIRSCGRTDFQQGSSEKLFRSVRDKLFRFPDDTLVYPGHDYRGQTSSSIGAEKKFNARLKESIQLEDFKKIMAELKLANPKKIHEAVPANLACGRPKDARVLHPQVVDGIPEISPKDVFSHIEDAKKGKIKLIDVRRPDEYKGELGHVDGAVLVTLGPELTSYLENGQRSDEIVFICRSGGRSGTATAESIRMGYKFTTNMVGGMIEWNEKNLPTVKE